MSFEKIEQFMNQVAESEELQARIGEEIDTGSLIVLGAECGFEFTTEELQELSRNGGVAWRHWRSFLLPKKGLSFWPYLSNANCRQARQIRYQNALQLGQLGLLGTLLGCIGMYKT